MKRSQAAPTHRHGRDARREADWEAAWDEFDRRQPAAAPLPAPVPEPEPEAPPERPPEEPPAKPRRGLLRRYLPLTALLLVSVAAPSLALVYQPLMAARDVMRAVAQADAEALAARVDWEAIRPGLRAALVAEGRMTQERGFSTGARAYLVDMASAMTAALEDRPEAMAGLLRSRAGGDWQGGEGDGLLPSGSLRRLRPEGLSSLRLELGPRAGVEPETAGLSLTLAPGEKGDASWRIVSLEFGAP
ncbi:DUF2939 domain-containing protein [Acetobacteraceae bacterium H6797]|nr:DUF2939 domain-containing protein [Acetobacteraceae bacterium H6797]